ncbi:hypothetical protein HK101_002044 [Irineochytrium annulatum]|nr:hypothetical protein HK101_002044 [Irineochytrium annulatum]
MMGARASTRRRQSDGAADSARRTTWFKSKRRSLATEKVHPESTEPKQSAEKMASLVAVAEAVAKDAPVLLAPYEKPPEKPPPPPPLDATPAENSTIAKSLDQLQTDHQPSTKPGLAELRSLLLAQRHHHHSASSLEPSPTFPPLASSARGSTVDNPGAKRDAASLATLAAFGVSPSCESPLLETSLHELAKTPDDQVTITSLIGADVDQWERRRMSLPIEAVLAADPDGAGAPRHSGASLAGPRESVTAGGRRRRHSLCDETMQGPRSSVGATGSGGGSDEHGIGPSFHYTHSRRGSVGQYPKGILKRPSLGGRTMDEAAALMAAVTAAAEAEHAGAGTRSLAGSSHHSFRSSSGMLKRVASTRSSSARTSNSLEPRDVAEEPEEAAAGGGGSEVTVAGGSPMLGGKFDSAPAIEVADDFVDEERFVELERWMVGRGLKRVRVSAAEALTITENETEGLCVMTGSLEVTTVDDFRVRFGRGRILGELLVSFGSGRTTGRTAGQVVIGHAGTDGCECFLLKREDVDEFMIKFPELGARMMREAQQRSEDAERTRMPRRRRSLKKNTLELDFGQVKEEDEQLSRHPSVLM